MRRPSHGLSAVAWIMPQPAAPGCGGACGWCQSRACRSPGCNLTFRPCTPTFTVWCGTGTDGGAINVQIIHALKLVLGRGTARAEDAQGTPTQSHISPSILVYEDYTDASKPLTSSMHGGRGVAGERAGGVSHGHGQAAAQEPQLQLLQEHHAGPLPINSKI